MPTSAIQFCPRPKDGAVGHVLIRIATLGSESDGDRRSRSARPAWELVCAVRHLLAIAAWLFVAGAAQAANIHVKALEPTSALVVIEGDLELTDIESFRSKIASLSKATVAFRSDGGSLLAGIRIGMLIRVKNFITVVPDQAQCASACAVAWLGGVHRFMGAGSKVGFHAAYIQKGGATAESGPGNAVLGAYLDQIGLPEDAIIYITQAAPSSMKWLTMDEAAQHGIDVALLPPADPAPAAAPGTATATAAAAAAVVTAPEPPPLTGLAARAIGRVSELAARWSSPNAEMLGALDEFYGDKVFYHGKVVPRQAVLSEKKYFAERWPQRSYKIRPHSLSVSCNAAEVCRVQGVMDRELANAKTNATSRDVTSFDYSFARAGESLRIASETSSVSKLPAPASGGSDGPITSVQRGLERLLAQVSRLRPSEAPPRPSAPVPH